MQRRALLTVFAAAAILLSGCQSLKTASEGRLTRGRFSIVLPLDGRRQSQTGRFELLDAPNLTLLDLLTPLSGVMARVESTPKGAAFWRGLNEEPVKDKDLDALLTPLLGFPVPLKSLARLLRPTSEQLPNRFSDAGWTIQILKRAPDGRPLTLRLSRPGDRPDEPDAALTIAVLENDD